MIEWLTYSLGVIAGVMLLLPSNLHDVTEFDVISRFTLGRTIGLLLAILSITGLYLLS